MRKAVLYFCIALCICKSTYGRIIVENGWPAEVGAPETRQYLQCVISLTSNISASVTDMLVTIELRNSGTGEIQMPFPYGREPGMKIRFIVLSNQQGQRKEGFGCESKLAVDANAITSKVPMWIAVPPRSVVRIATRVTLARADELLTHGAQYGLKCEIEYHMPRLPLMHLSTCIV